MLNDNQNIKSANLSKLEPRIETFSNILAYFFSKKWWVLLTISISIILAFVFIVLTPKKYLANAQVLPVESSKGNIGSLMGQFSGLAGVAGLDLSSASGGKVNLAILQSKSFIISFIDKRSLVVPLLAVKGWDKKEDKLIYDTSQYIPQEHKWVRVVSEPYTQEPSLQEAYEAFIKIFHVRKNSETGIVTVGIEYYSPEIARKWVDWLIHDVNAAIANRHIMKADNSLRYLYLQLELTKLEKVKALLYKLIEEQIHTKMLAKVSNEYAFSVIDSAIAPQFAYKPNKAFIVLGVIIMSLLVSFLVILFRYYIKLGSFKS